MDDVVGSCQGTMTDAEENDLFLRNANDCNEDVSNNHKSCDKRLLVKCLPQPCDQCGKTFSNLSNLLKHIKVLHNGWRFSCGTCGRKFSCKEAVKRHMRVMHEKLRCDICHKIFDSSHAKDVHECSGAQSSAVTCSFCNKTFSCKSNLNKHKQVVHMGRTFTCATCSKVLRSHESVVEHNRSAHGIFLCSKCGSLFYSEESFAQHVSVEHHFHISLEASKVNVKQTTAGERSLFKTMRRHHPVSCDRCGKVFSSQSNLTKHIRSVHNSKWKCKQCSIEFSCRELLQSHISNSHEQMFKCVPCSLQFHKRRSLRVHQQVVHNILVPDKSCQCEVCGKTFLYMGNLKRHVKKDHERMQFSCHVCKMHFKSKRLALDHQSTEHDVTTNGSCSECSESFPSVHKLCENMCLIRKNLIHSCSICKKESSIRSIVTNNQEKHLECKQNLTKGLEEVRPKSAETQCSLLNIYLHNSEMASTIDLNMFELSSAQDVELMSQDSATLLRESPIPSEQQFLFE